MIKLLKRNKFNFIKLIFRRIFKKDYWLKQILNLKTVEILFMKLRQLKWKKYCLKICLLEKKSNITHIKSQII